MAGGYTPLQVIRDISFREYLAQGQAILSYIVITERAGLVGIIQDGQPPVAWGRLFAMRNETQVGINAPLWSEVPGYLGLQGGEDILDLRVREDRARIDNRNLNFRHDDAPYGLKP